jgi:hypothetical protein
VVDIDTRRDLRSRTERIRIEPDTAPDAALARAFATSPLLRPGRSTHTRELVETSRVIYDLRPHGGEDDGCRVGGEKVAAILPPDLRAGLLGAVAQRRVRGPATLELGPLARAEAVRTSFGALAHGQVGVIADRSDAAVTVLVVGVSGLLWARSVPSDDAALAVRLLIDRACGMLALSEQPRWWRLHDVATHEDERAMVRGASEFAAATASELDGVPLVTPVLA